MVTVRRVDRKSAVLTPSNLACLSGIPTINLTSGCVHGCRYCYIQGYSTYPGENTVVVYTNTLTKLREELARKRKPPQAIYFSPSSDIFQPIAEVLDLTYDILKFLFEVRINVVFLTKGHIPQRHMELVCANASHVEAQIGLTTLDSTLSEAFEPRAASPTTRLSQAKRLVEAGVPTRGRLDPILPGLTDDAHGLAALCAALADCGVQEVAVGTLFLRPAIRNALAEGIPDEKMRRALLSHFSRDRRVAIRAKKSTVIALPSEARRLIYERVSETAGRYGINVRICACKNPDIAKGSCHIAGTSRLRRGTPVQQAFLDFVE